MTEIQYLHHEEQMEAVRAEFLKVWEKQRHGYTLTARQLVQIMDEEWKAYKRDHPIK